MLKTIHKYSLDWLSYRANTNVNNMVWFIHSLEALIYDTSAINPKQTINNVINFTLQQTVKPLFDTSIGFNDIAQEVLMITWKYFLKERNISLKKRLTNDMNRYFRRQGVGFVYVPERDRKISDLYKNLRRTGMNEIMKREFVSMVARFVMYQSELSRLTPKETAIIMLIDLKLPVGRVKETLENIGMILKDDSYIISRVSLHKWKNIYSKDVV